MLIGRESVTQRNLRCSNSRTRRAQFETFGDFLRLTKTFGGLFSSGITKLVTMLVQPIHWIRRLTNEQKTHLDCFIQKIDRNDGASKFLMDSKRENHCWAFESAWCGMALLDLILWFQFFEIFTILLILCGSSNSSRYFGFFEICYIFPTRCGRTPDHLRIAWLILWAARRRNRFGTLKPLNLFILAPVHQIIATHCWASNGSLPYLVRWVADGFHLRRHRSVRSFSRWPTDSSLRTERQVMCPQRTVHAFPVVGHASRRSHKKRRPAFSLAGSVTSVVAGDPQIDYPAVPACVCLLIQRLSIRTAVWTLQVPSKVPCRESALCLHDLTLLPSRESRRCVLFQFRAADLFHKFRFTNLATVPNRRLEINFPQENVTVLLPSDRHLWRSLSHTTCMIKAVWYNNKMVLQLAAVTVSY